MDFNFFQEPKRIIKDLPIPPAYIGKYTAKVAQKFGLEPSMGRQPYEVFKRALVKMLKEKGVSWDITRIKYHLLPGTCLFEYGSSQ
jgi:hypothetical protein